MLFPNYIFKDWWHTVQLSNHSVKKKLQQWATGAAEGQMSRGALMCAEVPLIQLTSGAASCQDPTSGSQRGINRDGRQCDAASGELQHSVRVYGAEVPADLRADAGQSHRWSQSEQSAARAARVRTSHGLISEIRKARRRHPDWAASCHSYKYRVWMF